MRPKSSASSLERVDLCCEVQEDFSMHVEGALEEMVGWHRPCRRVFGFLLELGECSIEALGDFSELVHRSMVRLLAGRRRLRA
jgi:hypothetical protein